MKTATLLFILLTSFVDVQAGASIGPGAEVSNTAYNPGSHMNPHVPRARGPWFEGWYTRVSDPTRELSFAVIGASSLRREQWFRPDEAFSGYLAVLIHERGGPMRVIELFPERTSMKIDGKPLRYYNPVLLEPRFEWSAGEFARITQDEIEISIPDKLQLRAALKNRQAWQREGGPDWGPEGLLGYISLIPLHWYVYSLGSDTAYTLTLTEGDTTRAYEGHGFGHQEKNWGTVFPKAWVWSQATSEDNSAQLALAGGLASVGGIVMKKWMLGYRAPGLFVSFSPDQIGATFSTTVDACAGQFTLEATNGSHAVALSAEADPESFGKVSIPLEDGFMPGAIESFAAQISVKVYDVEGAGGTARRQPIESRVFRRAALEFGAGYMDCLPRNDSFTVTR